MPIAPIGAPPVCPLMWAASARSQVVTGEDTPARRLANSRDMHSLTALRSGARLPSGPNSQGTTTWNRASINRSANRRKPGEKPASSGRINNGGCRRLPA